MNTHAVCLGEEEDPRRWYTSREIEGCPIAFNRAEVGVFLTEVTYIAVVSQRLGKILYSTVHCDNQDAVFFAQSTEVGTSTPWADKRNSNWRITLKSKLKSSEAIFTFKQVKGYQDKESAYKELDLHGKINFHCDKMANFDLGGDQPDLKASIRNDHRIVTDKIDSYTYRKKYRDTVQ